jgi:hypothetical protein
MPAAREDSPAATKGYDPFRFTRTFIFSDGIGWILKPFMWGMTEYENIYICANDGEYGWLLKTAEAVYLFVWDRVFGHWFCNDNSFGFYENSPEEPDERLQFYLRLREYFKSKNEKGRFRLMRGTCRAMRRNESVFSKEV